MGTFGTVRELIDDDSYCMSVEFVEKSKWAKSCYFIYYFDELSFVDYEEKFNLSPVHVVKLRVLCFSDKAVS